MKIRVSALFLALLICISFLCSCADFVASSGEVSITYEKNNGEAPETLGISIFGIERPYHPEREGYIFMGWYKDEACTKPYDFDQTPTHSITLYAAWRFDAESVLNRFVETTQSSTVMINCTFYNATFFGEIVNSKTVSGSGVIIFEDEASYYILTNNHVVNNTSGLHNAAYEVVDAYARVHNATLLYRDAAYDLALLSIAKGKKELSVAPLADAVAPVATPVIAVGAPNGQINTVSIGSIVDFDKAEIDNADAEDNAICFCVLFHDAPIGGGSSGGALFDERLNLIGINFAATEQDEAFKLGLAVSADKIRDFLQATTLKKHFPI